MNYVITFARHYDKYKRQKNCRPRFEKAEGPRSDILKYDHWDTPSLSPIPTKILGGVVSDSTCLTPWCGPVHRLGSTRAGPSSWLSLGPLRYRSLGPLLRHYWADVLGVHFGTLFNISVTDCNDRVRRPNHSPIPSWRSSASIECPRIRSCLGALYGRIYGGRQFSPSLPSHSLLPFLMLGSPHSCYRHLRPQPL